MADEKMPEHQPETGNKKAGFAMVGIGELTETQLLPAFKACSYAAPVALVGDDHEKMIKAGKEYGITAENIYSYDTFDDIASNEAIDIVYIVLPNSLHKEYTIRSAKAGKHVLCEKPMSDSVQAAEAMIKACEEAGRRLMVAYRIQYEPHHKLMRDWVQDHIFGKVKIIEAFNAEYIDDPTQWRFDKKLAGGGVLMDLGIYCVNTIRFITGLEPVWVSANDYSTPGDERFKAVEETILFQMGFANGLVATCGSSYGVHGTQRYRCYTEKDAWFGMDPAFAYTDLAIEISTIADDKNFPVPVIENQNQFALLLDHMAQCVLQDQVPDTPGEEGLKDMIVIDALYKSAREKRVVQL